MLYRTTRIWAFCCSLLSFPLSFPFASRPTLFTIYFFPSSSSPHILSQPDCVLGRKEPTPSPFSSFTFFSVLPYKHTRHAFSAMRVEKGVERQKEGKKDGRVIVEENNMCIENELTLCPSGLGDVRNWYNVVR